MEVGQAERYCLHLRERMMPFFLLSCPLACSCPVRPARKASPYALLVERTNLPESAVPAAPVGFLGAFLGVLGREQNETAGGNKMRLLGGTK